MKTKEELNKLKIEYESLSRKLAELTDDELEQVTGGGTVVFGENRGPCRIQPEDGGKDIFARSIPIPKEKTIVPAYESR